MTPDEPFRDRADAGRRLAVQLLRAGFGEDTVVVGLPRGGVPVAFEVAEALQAPLDLIPVRKLGLPGQPELAMGAIGESGVRVLNDRIVARLRDPEGQLAAAERAERPRLEHQARLRGDRPSVPLRDRTVIVVDDGVATGSTARAACQVVRGLGATRVVLAVPVAPAGAAARFTDVADTVVCLRTPDDFAGVGQFYEDFRPTPDGVVTALLHRARE
ncbi:MAG: putative phosphoribosyl transferase [Pseudonocardiales bacterium]|nr:putative phosphoribosyl transferase [Pseudonocardiales bacterium]